MCFYSRCRSRVSPTPKLFAHENLAAVTRMFHVLLCAGLIDVIFLTDEASATAGPKSVIRVADGEPSVLRCIVNGGFPPPNIVVLVGPRDATDDFRITSRSNVTGSRGLRLVTYRSERHSDQFVARRDDNGLRVQCIGTVPGLKPRTTSAVLDILCECPLYCI